MDTQTAVEAWQDFANGLTFEFKGDRRTWARHIGGPGAADEDSIVQPLVFPKFAEEFLNFVVGDNLAPEILKEEGKPDFRPADAVTHSFVFETKATRTKLDFSPYSEQISRYLTQGRARIKYVVVTNLLGLTVYSLGDSGQLETYLDTIDLRVLLKPLAGAAKTGHARRLSRFIEEFSHKVLTTEEKLERVRDAPPWTPHLEVTNPEWTSRQLDRVVEQFRRDAESQIANDALYSATLSDKHRQLILEELHELDFRLGADWDETRSRSLADYLSATDDTTLGRARLQFETHVAYFAATRMFVVRIWEDLDLVAEFLRDGGFKEWMSKFDDVVRDVVDWSFRKAEKRYPSLFAADNNYTWFAPSEEVLTNVLYDLSNTYLGDIASDVLGDVYQRLLERIDRKNIGQYYTPRDIIGFMWDLLDFSDAAQEADAQNRGLRVLDIATGSGGFLVEAARRSRIRSEGQIDQGAALDAATALQRLAGGLVGVEIQRFPAYLAEVNLLVQLGGLMSRDPEATVPPLGVLWADTMSLHEPQALEERSGLEVAEHALLEPDPFRDELYTKVKDVASSDFEFDVATGNPPYIGEKRAAPILRRTREAYPYWEDFVAAHLDVLYWFLILGVSKLREGGRFAFITTEYWLRAEGAAPLRNFLAERCSIDRIVLFGDLRLFPDAPGQHSMIVSGKRTVDRTDSQAAPPESFPLVSRYAGSNLPQDERAVVLKAMMSGTRGSSVSAFRSKASPNTLKSSSWAEVVLSPQQIKRRRALAGSSEPLTLTMEEGVIATPDRLRRQSDADKLPSGVTRQLGFPESNPPIYVFRPGEIDEFGSLTEDEARACRPIVNTADVYPYAAVLPAEPSSLLYLPKPEAVGSLGITAAQQLEFPSGMPKIQRHLEQYRPLLESKVRGWNEKRPWWSVHRPRPTTIARDSAAGSWANYALTTRWGSGSRLIAGLAPGGSVPASGLHALTAADPASAAYVVALMLSTPVQELVDGLPPGEIRQADIEALGLPLFPGAVADLSQLAIEQADTVLQLVTHHGAKFPTIPPHLRDDVTLAGPRLSVWVPEAGPDSSWGSLSSVAWVTKIEASRKTAVPVATVHHERDLFGNALIVEGAAPGTRLRILVDEEDEATLDAIAAALRGAGHRGCRLKEIPDLAMPITARDLTEALNNDTGAVEAAVGEYQGRRTQIDELVDTLL